MGKDANEINQRCDTIPGGRYDIVHSLQDMLHRHHTYVSSFKSKIERMSESEVEYKVIIKADKNPDGEHERRFNAPVTNEVAILIVGQEFERRDIIMVKRCSSLLRISEIHRAFDTLQYPRIFWKGQDGYNFKIPQTDPKTRRKRLDKKLSSMDFYAYGFMLRDGNFNLIHRGRTLFHQIVVDLYAKVETERLLFIHLHQKKLPVDDYILLRDTVATDGNPHDFGKLVILPSSFTGSPRYMHERTQDAMTYVRNYGRPDLFITFTYDTWTVWNSQQEFPVYEGWRCTKDFPKRLVKETQSGDDGYPKYRRRAPEDGGFTATIQRGNQEHITVDNKWVVSYSPLLCKAFDVHINVEYCNLIKSIKYVCKYISKGTDQAIFTLESERDEITEYQHGRYIRSNEALWRLFSFPIHERYPTVIHLSVHLQNGQCVYFTQDSLQRQLEAQANSTLTVFFQLCREEDFAKTLLYVNVPKYYTWCHSTKRFTRRTQGADVEGFPGIKASDALGRVYTIHPNNFECFCLRMLLDHVHGPTTFDDLRTVDGHICQTYREACNKEVC
ncbi:hypothetical protein LOD99_2235 [Oopsacas minuta]|uniref:Helitron helicase-like domain-containing protein n=1 Tax=Oopsacas minuta TaxID=111878 RepID=A0AAV7K3N5_9METZ|nr:hypothetical protein LOD99_2235 [Oopsacas minuta]